MKKRLIAMILVLTFALAAFSGCSLISKDEERDIQQIVATVKTEDRTDNITKRELISYFNSYGYSYMYYYGMTAEQALDYLLDQLVNRKIIIQNAEKTLPVLDEGTIVGHRLEKYMTENQINTIKKTVNEAIIEGIESYLNKDTDDEETEDDTAEETRVTPTYEKEEIEEIVTADDVPAIDKDSTKAVKNAYAQFEKSLKENYYTYDGYYEMLVVSELEDEMVSMWQESVKEDVTVSMDELQTRYNEMLETQKESYTTPAAYKTALEGVSSSSFVLYNQAVGYGYVYNIVIPFSDYQANILSKYTAAYQAGKMTTSQYENIRNALLANVVAKDLRESWITAGYDYDFATKTFGEDYCKSSGIPFDGEVTFTYTNDAGEEVVLTNEQAPEDVKGKYSYVLNEIPMGTFIGNLNTWIGADADTTTAYPYAGKVNEANTSLAEAKDIFMDLQFAYGSDTGILNSFKGYVSAPKPSDNASETYVKEFADAARDVVNMGAGNYVVVGTDYGWHVIYCTEAIGVGSGEVLNAADIDTFGTFTYRFKKVLLDSLQSTQVSEKQAELINSTKENSDGIKTYKSRYSDLFS